MKTNVAQTSIQSYDALKRGKLSNQEAVILLVMQRGHRYTRRELARKTKLETSAVAGRVNKLVADGLLVEDGTLTCTVTGKNVGAVKLAEKQVGH